MNFLSTIVADLDVVLQVVLVLLLLRSANYRRYPLLFVYCLVLLPLTLTETWAVMHGVDFRSVQWRTLYWRNELVVDLLLFLMVIGLTLKALEASPLRDKFKRVLLVITAAVLILPFVIFPSPRFNTVWFYHTSQLLNFGGAILNLGLWGALLGNRKRDPRLVAVSAGLGLAVTGAAIAYGVMLFTRKSGVGQELVDLFKSATHAAGMLIWCWAFFPFPKRQASPQAATSH